MSQNPFAFPPPAASPQVSTSPFPTVAAPAAAPVAPQPVVAPSVYQPGPPTTGFAPAPGPAAGGFGPRPAPVFDWSGIDTAQTFTKGNPLKPVNENVAGVYQCQIDTIILKETQQYGIAYIVEFTVLESNNPLHPVGSTASWFQKMQNKAPALSSIKEFFISAKGVDHRTAQGQMQVKLYLDPVLMQAITQTYGPEQSLKNARVNVEVRTIMTKAKNMPFNRYSFTPVL